MAPIDLVPPNKVPWDGKDGPTNTLRYDPKRCVGCGTCANVCPHQVFALENKKAVLVRYEACMECGACALNCPARAILVDSGVWMRGGHDNIGAEGKEGGHLRPRLLQLTDPFDKGVRPPHDHRTLISPVLT